MESSYLRFIDQVNWETTFPGNLSTIYRSSGIYTRPNGHSDNWINTSISFPLGIFGSWKRDTYGNTLTITEHTIKSSSQNYSWNLCIVSDDSYTLETDGYFAPPLAIKLLNGSLVINGDRGTGQDNWNGTWKKLN